MFETVGHHVEKIKRVRYGPLTLDVPPGQFRVADVQEIERAEVPPATNRWRGTKHLRGMMRQA